MLSRYATNTICTVGKYMQSLTFNYPNHSLQSVRYIRKHYNPKFKKERAAKVIKITLPDMDNDPEDITTKEKMRSKLKEHGMYPEKPWVERPLFVCCSAGVVDPYVVPEGDGKYSTLTKEGVKQKYTLLERKGKSAMAIKKIKSLDDTYRTVDFADQALETYINAHQALAAKSSKEELCKYVTEFAYPKMTHNAEDKTIRWQFVESLEPARVVCARVVEMIKKGNNFGQITVRFNTQQILSIYDRFGRLIQGSEILKKDVLEYVVFEKYLSYEYGAWRIHAKIIPPWMSPREVHEKTYSVKPETEKKEDRKAEAVMVDKSRSSQEENTVVI